MPRVSSASTDQVQSDEAMGWRPTETALQKRSLTLAGHRTSLALEPAFWRALERAAAQEGVSLPALIARIDQSRAVLPDPPPLASSVRVWALERAEAKGAER